MRWRTSTSVSPAPGFIAPCIPSAAKQAPRGSDWIFEIKHDGYRLQVRRQEQRVRIYSRNGADFTSRFPRIVAAALRLKPLSFVLDGEGVVYDPSGLPDFQLIHSKQYDGVVSFIAFDLLELDSVDLRRQPLIERKARLAKLLARRSDGLEYNEHLQGDGTQIFEHACRLQLEGIVAKRHDLGYESGRSKRWIKIKNPDSHAMQRVRDETF